MVALMSLGQFLFKTGAMQLPPSAYQNLFNFIFAMVSNIYVWATLAIYGVAFGLWFFILSKFDLSFAFPIVTVSVLIFAVAASYFFFGEGINAAKIAAVTLIVAGILLLAWK